MTRTLSLLGASLAGHRDAPRHVCVRRDRHRHRTRRRGDASSPWRPHPRRSPRRPAPPRRTADPTCETIIPAATVADFESVGWTARAEPFRIGELEIPEGVQCVWGDFTTATDHVQIFGWAPISEDDAAEAQDALVGQGWTRRRDRPRDVIVTESAETTVATDDEGYGLTYLFGDGWVKYADTKQGLLLVTWGSG